MIRVDNVSKNYKIMKKKAGVRGYLGSFFKREYTQFSALKDVSFCIEDGEIVSLLGSNGAGKSTLIKIMTGILLEDSGSVIVNGFNPFKHRTKYTKEISVVFGQKSQLWWELPVIDSFKIIKELYDVADSDFQTRMDILQKLFKIEKLLDKSVRSLSLGQRTLCDIAAAFVCAPKVIFLDEPTIGLDVYVKGQIHYLIKLMNENFNTTVIITTHDVADIMELAKRVIIVSKGKILYDTHIEKITQMFGESQLVEIEFVNSKSLADFSEKLYEKNIKFDKISYKITVEVDNKQELNFTLINLLDVSSDYTIAIRRPTIENVLKKIYREDAE